MAGRRLNTFALAQILAVGALFWILFSQDRPWNALRYAGTAVTVLGAVMLGAAPLPVGQVVFALCRRRRKDVISQQ
jgi:hypothetical protein